MSILLGAEKYALALNAGIESWATGGGMDYLVKPVSPTVDLTIADPTGDGSPYDWENPESDWEAIDAAVFTQHSFEQHDWQDTDLFEQVFSGTFKECIDWVAAHDVVKHTKSRWLGVWGEGYMGADGKATVKTDMGAGEFTDKAGYDVEHIERIMGLEVGESVQVQEMMAVCSFTRTQ